MTPVPLDLPLRPSEAAELAGLIFESAERKPLTDEVRNRVAARAAALHFETITPHFGSLERDPVHHSTYYVAVDVPEGLPLLLHLALATAPTSSIFHKPLLIGRMRRALGPEIVINAIPFGATDADTLEKFVTHIDKTFLPRPHGSRTTIVAGMQAAASGPAGAFDAFRRIWKRTGRNVASIGAEGEVPASVVYYNSLWAAIRSGWRDGYSTVARIAPPFESAKDSIREAALFSTFVFDPATVVRRVEGQTETAINQIFETSFPAEERGWIFDEFVRTFNTGELAYELTPADALSLAVQFGEGLLLGERVHNQIRQTRSALKINRPFDFELALDRVPTGTTPRELIFCLQWLKARGHAVQLAAPNLQAASEPGVRELAAICRHFQCGMDFSASDSAAQLETVARASAGRFTCSLWGTHSGAAAIEHVAESLLG
ncbi:conserved hypothetical protein [Candidatus Sulfopaludibacter sp. SbA3]|nr:conserved hypothetical protein [Candidatus Sulfopaludibacter sp. SbA3]